MSNGVFQKDLADLFQKMGFSSKKPVHLILIQKEQRSFVGS
jgi:hypothetical protein